MAASRSQRLHSRYFAVRSASHVSQSAPSDKAANFSRIVSGKRAQASSAVGLCSGVVGERRSGSRAVSRNTRLLRASFSKAQARWIMAEGHRSIGLERLHSESFVQNGDGNGRPGVIEERHVGFLNRPFGRLLPYPHPRGFPQVLQGGFGREGVPVQGYADGAECGRSYIHQGNVGVAEGVKARGDCNSRLFGRLAGQGGEPRAGATTDHTSGGVVSVPRADSKLQEIGVGSSAGDSVFRGAILSQAGVGSGPRVQVAGYGRSYSEYSGQQGGFGQVLAFIAGQARLGDASDQAGDPTQTPNPEISARAVESGMGWVGSMDSSTQRGGSMSAVVDGKAEYADGGDSVAISAGFNPVYRCQPGGVRRVPGGPRTVRGMGSRGSNIAFKQQRIVGGVESSSSFSRNPAKSGCSAVFRQRQYDF